MFIKGFPWPAQKEVHYQKLGNDCETDRESGSSQPIKVAHTEGAATPIALLFKVVYKIHLTPFRGLQH